MNKPYKEDGKIRIFSKNIESDELHWHRDREDRIITPLNNNDWMFQRENCLPEPINKKIKISKGEWHRIIKGTTDLEVEVLKLKD